MKKKPKNPIYKEEYVSINGIEQYLFHSGKSHDNPVLLVLHGGPGFGVTRFAHAFQADWEEVFTVVHWDQRGAGSTLLRNPTSFPTIDLMLQDVSEVIQHLKKTYNKDKIVLLGHSWGTVLGSLYIHRHPEDVSYYVGVSQVINLRELERTNFEKLKKLITEANDKKSLKRLENIGDYPGETFDDDFFQKCSKVRKLQSKFKLSDGMIDLSMFLTALKSPLFRPSDLSAMAKAPKANKEIYKFLGTFDLKSLPLEYKVPVHYISGQNDQDTPYFYAQEYYEEIKVPNKSFTIIPDAKHEPMVQQPELFFQAFSTVHQKELCPKML